MSKLEMNSRLLTWIRLMIGHFLEGWTYFTRKNESVMSVKVCPWWPFNMRSITCNWLRNPVHRKSWNRRLERVWTLDFLCLRLSNFCLIPLLNQASSSWSLDFESSQDLESDLSAREIVTWRCALSVGERTRGEDGRMGRCIDVHARLNHHIANQFLQL